jgi:SNF2 family DNA or RNA helicase
LISELDPGGENACQTSYAVYPTKFYALLQNIQSYRAEKWYIYISPVLNDSFTDKSHSIVFSEWKKSLDIAAIVLGRETIHHARIDGSVPNSERLRVLERFRTEPGLNVLLMTIGTGAVG